MSSQSVEQALRRYIEVQKQEQQLREEKSQLQSALAEHLERQGVTLWFPEVDGQKLKVRYTRTVVVEYDEEKLRHRLGDRYATLLAPDWRKVRRHLDEVAPALAPFLSLVGSPVPEKVRDAVEHGVVRKEEFDGAFCKSVRRLVAVSRQKPDGAERQAGQ